MRLGIVEGEPGAFPDPVARLLRKLGGLVTRRKRAPDDPPPPAAGEAKAEGEEGSPSSS